jgi:hypothetical protein
MLRYKPHTTYVGRVVYNRKLHPFGPRDLLRIQQRVIEESPTESELEQLLRDLSIQMLDIMLGPVGKILPPEKVFQWIYNLVDETLEGLRGILAPNQYQSITKQMALLIEGKEANV